MIATNWKNVFLPEVTSFQEGPGVRKSQFSNNGIKLLNVHNLVNNQLDTSNTQTHISAEEANDRYKHFLVDEGDLIIASSGISPDTFREKVAFAKQENLPLCMNTSTIRFKSKNTEILNIKFLKYFFMTESFSNQIRKFITGSAQLNFGPSHLKKMKIPLPPIQVQREIVEILESVEKLRKKRENANKVLNKLLIDVFLEMFGNPVRNEKNWSIVKLENIAKVDRGRFSPRPRNDPTYYNGKYPFIQTGDIRSSHGFLNIWSQTLNEKGIRVSRSFSIGTIVIAIVGATIGETAILGKEVYAPDSVVGIQVNPEQANNVFIEFLLRFWKPVFRASAPQTARANINLAILRPLSIILPPVQIQNKFAYIAKNIKALAEKQRLSEIEIERLFNTLMSKAFKGELVTEMA